MVNSLENIRILDLSRVLAGPFCTQMLGDLGADIIKIERPGTGDDTRCWGPPFLKDSDGKDTQESAYYLSANRNKRSLALDIKSKEGQDVLHQLIAKSDVLIENFKVGGLEKYGLSYAQIKEQHPHLIYCSISGYGQDGPMAHDPGYDFLAQGFAGLMSATGEPNEPPMKVGVALSDIITGLNAAIGILAALNHKNQTGQGQHIDVALTDCTLASLSNLAQYYLSTNQAAPRLGNAHSTIVPYEAFKTLDNHIIIAVGNDNQFARFTEAIGQADWSDDERFKTNSARVKHRDILTKDIAARLASKTTDEWLGIFKQVRVPCGPVHSMDQVFAHEQIQQRGMHIKMPHERAGQDIDLIGSPLNLSETPVQYQKAPPCLGEHSQEILEKTLGLSAEDIDQLIENNVIEAKD